MRPQRQDRVLHRTGIEGRVLRQFVALHVQQVPIDRGQQRRNLVEVDFVLAATQVCARYGGRELWRHLRDPVGSADTAAVTSFWAAIFYCECMEPTFSHQLCFRGYSLSRSYTSNVQHRTTRRPRTRAHEAFYWKTQMNVEAISGRAAASFE